MRCKGMTIFWICNTFCRNFSFFFRSLHKRVWISAFHQCFVVDARCVFKRIRVHRSTHPHELAHAPAWVGPRIRMCRAMQPYAFLSIEKWRIDTLRLFIKRKGTQPVFECFKSQVVLGSDCIKMGYIQIPLCRKSVLCVHWLLLCWNASTHQGIRIGRWNQLLAVLHGNA